MSETAKQKLQVDAYASMPPQARAYFDKYSASIQTFLGGLGGFLQDDVTPMCLRELIVKQIHAAIYNIASLHGVDDGAEGF